MAFDRSKFLVFAARSGKSCKEIAELAGISEAAVSRILHGKNAPRIPTIGKLARALGVDVTEIIEGGEK